MLSEITRTQRYLTTDFIKKHRLAVPVLWFKPESATPDSEDLTKPREGLDCNLDEWLDTDRNVGARLCDGFIELKLKTPDDIWAAGLFKAFRILGVDARAAFGNHFVSSILLKVDGATDKWADRWPRGHKDKAGQWVETKFLTSQMPTRKADKPIWHHSAPLPGSRFSEQLVVWRPMGKPAAEDPELGLEDLEVVRPVSTTSMESICRAIAFATLAYWIDDDLQGLDWSESLIRTIGGWIARQVREGRDLNARGKSLEQVCWAPVDSPETAKSLIAFLGGGRELLAAYERAAARLEHDEEAPVPGWGAIETHFGVQARIGIRHAFKAGLDVEMIEHLSDRYVYDRSMHDFIDREAILKGTQPYAHSLGKLVEDYQNIPLFTPNGKKRLNVFSMFAGSSLRVDVHQRDFYPGHEPASILRRSPLYGLLSGEDHKPDEFRLFNISPGFIIKPIATVDKTIMRDAVSMLDRMLALITKENDAQMLWLKKFIAHIAQFPEQKPQVCPILVGGQGIGKGMFGGRFMKALFGDMAGLGDAPALTSSQFTIAPYIGKLIVFIDEVKLESVAAINIIKKMIREDYLSGEFKNKDRKDYYLPARLIIATNTPDIGLTPDDAADRAFYFIMSWTFLNKNMTEREFQEWALTLKPFYDELYLKLQNVVFRQHLMRYFKEIEVTRAELENLEHSSRDSPEVVRATMSKTRQIARDIVATARVLSGEDITSWFNIMQLRDAIRREDGAKTRVEAQQVLLEWQRADVIENIRGGYYKFKYRYGTLIQKLSEAHNLPIPPNYDYVPDRDWGENDVRSQSGGVPWRGNKNQNQQQQNYNRRNNDPDYMPPE